jgi:hypothetical protein
VQAKLEQLRFDPAREKELTAAAQTLAAEIARYQVRSGMTREYTHYHPRHCTDMPLL